MVLGGPGVFRTTRRAGFEAGKSRCVPQVVLPSAQHAHHERTVQSLIDCFTDAGRGMVPPILVFSNTGEWRDVRFLGLAVPGTSEQQIAEDLVAIWRTAKGMRFQNYRARFTILDAPLILRTWIDD
jgi:hypothetical protein